MRFDWQQLSPRERQILVRHFLLRTESVAAVTPEKVCAAMQKTHQLSCHTNKNGKAVIQFVTSRQGVQSGVSIAETFADGIFKAALRAKGVQLLDGVKTQSSFRRHSPEAVHA
jgi:hypothetical protein